MEAAGTGTPRGAGSAGRGVFCALAKLTAIPDRSIRVKAEFTLFRLMMNCLNLLYPVVRHTHMVLMNQLRSVCVRV